MKRRKFLKKTAGATVAFSIVPSYVLGKNHVPPSDTLYVASIGVGGRGAGIVKGLSSNKNVKFVALCDVDDKLAEGSYKMHPKTKKYKDFRKLYDNHINEIDAFTNDV